MNAYRLLPLFFVLLCRSLHAEPYIAIGNQKFFRITPPTGPATVAQQYLPKGEDLKHWNRSVVVQVFKNKKDPMEFLSQISARALLSKRHGKSNFRSDSKTKALTLDLTLGPASESQPVGEWNLIRATFVEGRGLIVCSYVILIRDYGKDSEAVVDAERQKWIEPFLASSFEEEEEPNQAVQTTPGLRPFVSDL